VCSDQNRPFSDVRILDMTHRYGRYATRLFADLGADVIRVEPPEGLPDRQAGAPGETPEESFAFLNANKRNVIVDFDTAAGKNDFEKLAADAQMIFVERNGPLFDDLAYLRSTQPTAVITAISPYGAGGPLAASPASDLTLQAAGGIAWMSGRPGEPPLRLPGEQSEMIASVYAATVSAIALLDAESNGHGHLIDVSVQECIAHSLQNAIQVWDLEKRVSMRGGEGTRDATEDIFLCKDGFIFLASPPSLGASWRQLVSWMDEVGHPSGEALRERCWSDSAWRTTAEARQAFRKLFEAFTKDLTKQRLTDEAVKRRLVLGPVSRIGELVDDEQLIFRHFFTKVASHLSDNPTLFPGAPYSFSESLWSTSAAPRLGGDREAGTTAGDGRPGVSRGSVRL
jgi:benzylsuccinate CoA-transferase BbsE subunit